MYKEERYITTEPNGRSKSIVIISKQGTGLGEFCLAIACITICILAVWWVLGNGNDNRGLHRSTTQSFESLPEDSRSGN